MSRPWKLGRPRRNRLAPHGAVALLTSGVLAGLVVSLAGLVVSPASAGFPAFDISPTSITIQAGDSVVGTVDNLPIASDGQPGCLDVASGTVPSYLSVVFSVPCGDRAGWSSSMTLRTIPATPAGTYHIVLQVCPSEACVIPDIRNVPPIETGSLTVVVTPAPVPVETVPFTGPAPTPAAAPRTPAPAPTPSRSPVAITHPTPGSQPAALAATSTPTPTPSLSSPSPSPSLSSGPSPSPSRAAAAGGRARSRSIRTGVVLVLAGIVILLAGAAGGWRLAKK